MDDSGASSLKLESIRESLIRQEDTIIFSLIERSKFPINSRGYDESLGLVQGFSGSLARFIIEETEALQAKAGRFQNPEEHQFFPENLPPSLVPPHDYPKVLYPAAASININKRIWDLYFNELLPLFTVVGDDGNYASAVASDLSCLQALSRRIHYGKFVAEVKFRDAQQDYEPAIRTKDRDALMKLLTFENVEEMVKKRVQKKALAFGQEVSLNHNDKKVKCKVDPYVVSRLYEEWIMPLTKLVQVEYLLHRLD
ncbi:Chorismate mutase [Tripterygium wilfordii]|uniref:Chorismate mutase n=1 Tax=Tripterygium wilfordii TaxID=458696 RepID=A0A7J7DP16_TRIWF|nr:chorismate mutase 2 [Tripterygium wilfordii]KAF5748122.1 Chorismate mutase [Tripterygium wilfordii]